MNNRYLAIMEKSLSAYADEHILRYFSDVKRDGLTEHGFPRLTVNIGILIAYGKRLDLLPIFLEMMEFCCKTIPVKMAANEFSVREITCCILELEKNSAVAKEDIARWKGYMSTITAESCYGCIAKSPTDTVKNWALFGCVSEFFRLKAGLCKNPEETYSFVELQIEQQLRWLDENGMYRDAETECFQPIVYDLVPRLLFSSLLHMGYRGKFYERLDGVLKKSALLTLNMQSTTGELAFGGRSNQFLHNEAWLAAIFEFEAARYKKSGDLLLAGRFKAAANRALSVVESWLSKTPITHIKNRFPIHSKFGCEWYAYFDKYMITVASFAYMASLFCDDSIQPIEQEEPPLVWSTSKFFHKTFVKVGEYSVEFDTNADTHYDANGLGRVHKRNAPSAICLSLPCPENGSAYEHDGYENQTPFSICPAIRDEKGEWLIGARADCIWSLIDGKTDGEKAFMRFDCDFGTKGKIAFDCTVKKDGVFVTAKQPKNEIIGICLPAFFFDGKEYAKITQTDGALCVEYDGWICEYKTQKIKNTNKKYANRNGVYQGYIAVGEGAVSVGITINKNKKGE